MSKNAKNVAGFVSGITIPAELLNTIKRQSGGKQRGEVNLTYFVTLENFGKGIVREDLLQLLFTVLLPEEIMGIYLMKDGNGVFIRLGTKKAVDKALTLDGIFHNGNIIRVRSPNNEKNKSEEQRVADEPPSKKKKINEEEKIIIHEIVGRRSDADENETNKIDEKDERCALFIGNSYYSITENQMRTFIESFAKPDDVNKFFQPKNKPRGFAFIELNTEETLEAILQLDGSKLMGEKARTGGGDREYLQDPDIAE